MGIRYLIFRIGYELGNKLNIRKLQYPQKITKEKYLSLVEWRKSASPFFFNSREDIDLKKHTNQELKINFDNIISGKIKVFNSLNLKLGKDYDWITNPDTGYKYSIKTHWSKIKDLNKNAGDIKYVWEKSRFSFIYTIIRYDYHFNQDNSEFVFTQILDWIKKNPLNYGPNYKCSQEISLRILNWIFALYFYKNSKYLNNEKFSTIIHSINVQIKHVYKNINFSRIAVRNNHTITETSLLFLSGLLFPFFKESKEWFVKGKKWLAQEINYQIYEDGSYLQFSHNYHRVVVQILVWVIRLSEINNIRFNDIFYERAKLTVNFLFQHQDENSGWLPNYGHNDGALFFPLNGNHFRDYRPQLQALGFLLGIKLYQENYEDIFWFGINPFKSNSFGFKIVDKTSILNFPFGGFYGFRDNSLTTIRCGAYKDRPSQADALNLDIWCDGINILRDPGTYMYNTEAKYLDFYNGTTGHNTLSIGDQSQMQRGDRFIWYYWTKYARADLEYKDDIFEFSGEIVGFPLAGKRIIHHRQVIKYKNINKWKIIDSTNYEGDKTVLLHWNINPIVNHKILITSFDKEGNLLEMEKRKGFYSELYGIKEETIQLVCKVPSGYAETTIELP